MQNTKLNQLETTQFNQDCMHLTSTDYENRT